VNNRHTARMVCNKRLCNGPVSVRLSVCLSRRSTASATSRCFAAAQAPAAVVDRYLPPAPERSSERAASYALIRGGGVSTQTSAYNLSGGFLSSSDAFSWFLDTYSVSWWTSLVTCCRKRHRFLTTAAHRPCHRPRRRRRLGRPSYCTHSSAN